MNRRIRVRNLVYVLIVLTLCVPTNAQPPIPQPARLAVLAPNLDVLYVGIWNRLTLNSYGYVLKNFDITAENGNVNYSSGSCTIMPQKAGNVIIDIHYTEDG